MQIRLLLELSGHVRLTRAQLHCLVEMQPIHGTMRLALRTVLAVCDHLNPQDGGMEGKWLARKEYHALYLSTARGASGQSIPQCEHAGNTPIGRPKVLACWDLLWPQVLGSVPGASGGPKDKTLHDLLTQDSRGVWGDPHHFATS